MVELVLRTACGVALALVVSSCASWTPVARNASWTLYAKDGETVDVDRFDRALAPAFRAVEERMGPFQRRVRVHAWDHEADAPTATLQGGVESEVDDVPGIGPARVRAFHVKGGSLLFEHSGVFLGVAEVGTAVHELVHARVAEAGLDLPLWFEEGVASYWGDGAYHDGAWCVDGLACWPLRELRDQYLEDAELARLLALHARDEYDARENLLVHFLGWAIVFDLAREAPNAHWLEWKTTFERESAQSGAVRAARVRLERVLGEATTTSWFERLKSAEPAVRLATAKGLWKLRDVRAIDSLLAALEREEQPELRVAFALNLLLASAEVRVGRTRWNRLAAVVFPTLREGQLSDEREERALRDVYAGLRRWDSGRTRGAQSALAELARLWEE